MVYKLFVDTNVFLDLLMQRGSEWQDAEQLFLLAENGSVKVYTSSSSLLNIMYIMNSSKLTRCEIVSNALGILSYTTLVNPDNVAFEIALSSAFKDLEDAVQYFTALEVKGIDHFITSNIKDFRNSLPQLPVHTPAGFLRKYYPAG